MPVTVVDLSRRRISRARLVRVAGAVMAAEGCRPDAELNVVIGDDAWMQELNRKYKGRNRPTDVLAFPQDAVPEGEAPVLGDVAISVETAERQATELGHSTLQELEILVAHGILHLTGWTDATPAQRRRMMARTEQVLATAGGRRAS